jgi:hypothetical protein
LGTLTWAQPLTNDTANRKKGSAHVFFKFITRKLQLGDMTAKTPEKLRNRRRLFSNQLEDGLPHGAHRALHVW